MIKPINTSLLAYKYKPLPKGLIYHNKINNIYHLIDTKMSNIVGEMLAYPILDKYETSEAILKTVYYISSLQIDCKERNKGWGKYFIDFAKKEAYKRGCEGRVSLISYNPESNPSVFYKKMGFVTNDAETNKSLMYYIKANERPSYSGMLHMYLPIATPVVIPETKQNSVTGKILKFIKSLVGIE